VAPQKAELRSMRRVRSRCCPLLIEIILCDCTGETAPILEIQDVRLLCRLDHLGEK